MDILSDSTSQTNAPGVPVARVRCRLAGYGYLTPAEVRRLPMGAADGLALSLNDPDAVVLADAGYLVTASRGQARELRAAVHGPRSVRGWHPYYLTTLLIAPALTMSTALALALAR